MDIQVATLCDSAADYSGKLCILGSFDTIAVRQLPAVHPHCSIAMRIVFNDVDEGKHKLTVNLIDEDGKSLLPNIEPSMDIRMPPNRFFSSSNLVLNLQGLKFEKIGQYSIDIAVDGTIMSRIPLQVVMMQEKAGSGQ